MIWVILIVLVAAGLVALMALRRRRA